MNNLKILQFPISLVRRKTDFKKVDSNLNLVESILIYQHKTINVLNKDKIDIIPISTIRYIQSASSYSIIFLEGGSKIITTKTLKYWGGKINSSLFLRSHNSYLINTKFVVSFYQSGNFVVMANKIYLPVSRAKKAEVLDYFD